MTYAIYNLLSIFFYNTGIYIKEIPKIFVAIAVASLFRLYLEFLLPYKSIEQVDLLFQQLPRWERRFGLAWRPETLQH